MIESSITIIIVRAMKQISIEEEMNIILCLVAAAVEAAATVPPLNTRELLVETEATTHPPHILLENSDIWRNVSKTTRSLTSSERERTATSSKHDTRKQGDLSRSRRSNWVVKRKDFP